MSGSAKRTFCEIGNEMSSLETEFRHMLGHIKIKNAVHDERELQSPTLPPEHHFYGLGGDKCPVEETYV